MIEVNVANACSGGASAAGMLAALCCALARCRRTPEVTNAIYLRDFATALCCVLFLQICFKAIVAYGQVLNPLLELR
jgi:hypothetical protein